MPCLTEERAALEAALTTVAEDSFFAMLDPAPEDWRDAVAGQDWVEATVSYHGQHSGTLACRVPSALALDLTSAFLGATPEDVEESAVHDMIGELANMICGCWLTRAYPADLFNLGRPAVVPTGAAPGHDWFVQLLNGTPFGVTVHSATR